MAGVLPVTLACVGFTAYLGLNRYPFGAFAPTFLGACERLTSAGLGPMPDDWFCFYQPQLRSIAPILSAFALGFGMALPGIILALRGSRLIALLPLITILMLDNLFGADLQGSHAESWQSAGLWWPPTGLGAGAQKLLAGAVLAIPTMAVVIFLHPARQVRDPIGWPSKLKAGTIVVPFTILITAPWILIGEYLVGPAIAMAIFGILMGRDRRWVPWSFAVVAIFLSQGPSQLLWRFNPEEGGTLQFVAVFALFAAASAGSAWHPIARLFELRREPREPRPWVRRPVVNIDLQHRGLRALNAASLIAVPASLALAFLLTGSHAATPSPTYIEDRVRAQDTVALRVLREALEGARGYRSQHGTYAGVGTTGTRSDQFFWTRHPGFVLSSLNSGVTVAHGGKHSITLTTKSYSDNVACLQRSGHRTSFSIAEDVRKAVATCSKAPASQAFGPTIPDCRSGSGYILCRMVQTLIVGMLDRHHRRDRFLPADREVEISTLPSGYPIFIVRNDDGGLSVIDAISPVRKWGIGHPLSWCPATRTFEDNISGSSFDEYGNYLAGPAPSGLRRFATVRNPHGEMFGIAGVIPGRTPVSVVKHHDAPHPCRRPIEASFENQYYSPPEGRTPGAWVVLQGKLVITRNGGAQLCQPPRLCNDPLPVHGVDLGILQNTWKKVIATPRRNHWLARWTPKGLDHIVRFPKPRHHCVGFPPPGTPGVPAC